MNPAKLVEIFYLMDEFCQKVLLEIHKNTLPDDGKRHRNRKNKMSHSEIMTILVLFHYSHYRDLKSFYLAEICSGKYAKEFPVTLSYNRFVERIRYAGFLLMLFLQTCALGKCTGFSIIDSTPLRSCHEKRWYKHKTMKGLAARGRCTMGWFFGFKLHLVINDKGEIIQWMLTPGNVDDRNPLKSKNFTQKLFGKIYADKGYISHDLFERLFIDDIHLVTKLRKNMKNSLMHLYDRIRLRKRCIIETVNDTLKNECQIEHTRHRSVDNFLANLVAGLVAYNLMPKKPEMNIDIIDKSKLIA